MMGAAVRVEERIRTFLAELSPRARSLLLRGVEGAIARGDGDPALALIFAAAQPAVPPIVLPAPTAWLAGEGRAHDLRRAVFAPITLFLVDESGVPSRPSRIAVESVVQAWAWLAREALADDIAAAMASDEPPADLAPDLRPKLLAAIDEAIAAAHRQPKGVTRLEAALGGEDALRDLRQLAPAFAEAEAVPALLAQLPAETGNDPTAIRTVAAILAKEIADRAGHQAWTFAAILHRLKSPVMLARLAVAMAGTTSPMAVADLPAGAAIDILVFDIEAEAARLTMLRTNRGPAEGCVAAIARFHDLVHETATVLDLGKAPRWSGRLAAAKAKVSGEIEREIDGAAGMVRRAISRRGAGADGPDPAAIADAERALTFMAAGEAARDSLALNQSLLTMTRDVGKTLSSHLDPLLQNIGRLKPAERAATLPWVDAGIRLAEVHFGAEYAASLRRIRAAAVGPTGRLSRAS